MSLLPATAEIPVGPLLLGGRRPFVLIAGPCVIEGEEPCTRVAASVARTCAELGVPFIFKASFDKANRTSIDGFRGPGLQEGLAILERIQGRLGVPVTTDVHEAGQAAAVAQVADLLQVPAFLCRQTDLLVACAATGRPVNVKKGQFMAPQDMANAVAKLRRSGDGGVMLTERGSSFGYNNLVVDMRGLALMRELGVPVCIDGTHSVQLPGGEGTRSGGQRRLAPLIARSAVAAGVDAVFLEVHEDPERALSDAATQLPLEQLPGLLALLVQIDRLIKG